MAVGIGMRALWTYDTTPGAQAQPPSAWPLGSRATPGLRLAGGQQDTLVMLSHPRCPCTRASIGILSEILARAPGRITAYVVFYEPKAHAGSDWEQTDLIRSARGLPGVSVVMDPGGRVARWFGARTSGQTLLFDSSGRLLFSGGVTSVRGHFGDSVGSDAIVSLAETGQAAVHTTPVYGCAIYTLRTTSDAGADSPLLHGSHMASDDGI